jgi:hypothetical protein
MQHPGMGEKANFAAVLKRRDNYSLPHESNALIIIHYHT